MTFIDREREKRAMAHIKSLGNHLDAYLRGETITVQLLTGTLEPTGDERSDSAISVANSEAVGRMFATLRQDCPEEDDEFFFRSGFLAAMITHGKGLPE